MIYYRYLKIYLNTVNFYISGWIKHKNYILIKYFFIIKHIFFQQLTRNKSSVLNFHVFLLIINNNKTNAKTKKNKNRRRWKIVIL